MQAGAARAVSGGDFPGAVKQPATITEDIPGSLTYAEFLKAVGAKKVEGVVFEPPAGDVAYALIDGKCVPGCFKPRFLSDRINYGIFVTHSGSEFCQITPPPLPRTHPNKFAVVADNSE